MKLPLKQLLLILAASATAYALFLLLTGGGQALTALQRLASPAGVAAAALCLLNYLLRGLRWRRWMAQFDRPLGLAEGLRIYLAGYTFTPTPGNVGEATRGLLLARHPLGPGESLALFGAERLADLLGLVLLALPGLAWWLDSVAPEAWRPRLLTGALVAALALLLALVLLYRFRTPLAGRLGWLQQAGRCLARQPLRWLGLTLAAWAAQGLAVWLICRDSGLPLGWLLASGFYALAMVGGALSLLPAGLGGMEAIFAGLLVAAGAELGQAAAITVLVRLLTLWLAVALGALALLYSAGFRRDLRLH